MKRILVAGGAGFIGSNLCRRLIDEGDAYVICCDNLYTGRKANIEGLLGSDRIELLENDITEPLEHLKTERYSGNVNPIGIRSCYDEGKRCAETLCFDYMREYGARIKVIRIFNTYGPNMSVDDGRVVSDFIVQALRGENITIYGDGSQRFTCQRESPIQ